MCGVVGVLLQVYIETRGIHGSVFFLTHCIIYVNEDFMFTLISTGYIYLFKNILINLFIAWLCWVFVARWVFLWLHPVGGYSRAVVRGLLLVEAFLVELGL